MLSKTREWIQNKDIANDYAKLFPLVTNKHTAIELDRATKFLHSAGIRVPDSSSKDFPTLIIALLAQVKLTCVSKLANLHSSESLYKTNTDMVVDNVKHDLINAYEKELQYYSPAYDVIGLHVLLSLMNNVDIKTAFSTANIFVNEYFGIEKKDKKMIPIDLQGHRIDIVSDYAEEIDDEAVADVLLRCGINGRIVVHVISPFEERMTRMKLVTGFGKLGSNSIVFRKRQLEVTFVPIGTYGPSGIRFLLWQAPVGVDWLSTIPADALIVATGDGASVNFKLLGSNSDAIFSRFKKLQCVPAKLTRKIPFPRPMIAHLELHARNLTVKFAFSMISNIAPLSTIIRVNCANAEDQYVRWLKMRNNSSS